ncbi:MAG: hypothetical protein ACRDTZ_11185 [Pseudonocardiaceae bacterium]
MPGHLQLAPQGLGEGPDRRAVAEHAGDYTISTPEQVHGMHSALPERYRAIAYVAAGCGLRGGDVFGLELGAQVRKIGRW